MIYAIVHLFSVYNSARFLLDYWFAGGWLMLPLCLITFFIWYRYLELKRQLKAALTNAELLLDRIEDMTAKDFFDHEFLQELNALPGALARTLRRCAAKVSGQIEFRDAFQECRHLELAHYSYAFYVLGASVAAAPLLGLLGTVFGMIDTFAAVTLESNKAADLMAAGISQALITTQVGLVAALPGTFGLAHLFRLYQHLRNNLDRCESLCYLLLQDTNAK